MKENIVSKIDAECPWRDTLHWYDSIDSTNTRAKLLAAEGAPHGTVIAAGSQTGGRGRMGRSFSSPDGMGVYFSVILRPGCPPEELMHLTCAAAVAACRAVEATCGVCPDIKWTNDLIFGRRKLGGILTELVLNGAGPVDCAVIGVGINCRQTPEDFPPELRDMATSVRTFTGTDCPPALLAAALTKTFYEMDTQLFSQKAALMDAYRRRCITLGQEISIVRGEEIVHATALDLDGNGGLTVRLADGRVKTVASGEVSIRGMYGYL